MIVHRIRIMNYVTKKSTIKEVTPEQHHKLIGELFRKGCPARITLLQYREL